MSQETAEWLNQNVLIGNTDKRGTAWHYRASAQGSEPNHYPGPIPIEDVRRRLFPWEAVEGNLMATGEFTLPDGTVQGLYNDTTGFKAVMRSDSGAVLGVFKDGYQIHQFETWLLDQVALILDDDLSIGSAGLLKGGAVAWVTVEVPDNITTPEGVEFRPHLTGSTSHDGSLASGWKRMIMLPVCDNTLAAGLREHGQEYRVRHTRYSEMRLTDQREALGIVYTAADDFAAEVGELCSINVTDDVWTEFLEAYVPLDEATATDRSKTMAYNKRTALDNTYRYDERVSPWKDSAFGVVQAVNTAEHHVWGSEKTRVERNMFRAVSGNVDKLDTGTMAVLNGILHPVPVPAAA